MKIEMEDINKIEGDFHSTILQYKKRYHQIEFIIHHSDSENFIINEYWPRTLSNCYYEIITQS